MADTLAEYEWDVILSEFSEHEVFEDAKDQPDESVALEELVAGVAGEAAVASGSASSPQDEEVGSSSVGAPGGQDGAPDAEAPTASGASQGMLVPQSPAAGEGAQTAAAGGVDPAACVASLAGASVAMKAVGAGAMVAGATTGQIKTTVNEVRQQSQLAAMWDFPPLAP